MAANPDSVTPPQPTRPQVGDLYTTRFGSECVVLAKLNRILLVEFADGSVRRIPRQEWWRMAPRPC